MTQLSPLVFYYHRGGSSAADASAPRLVLLASWMDARDAHVAKYVAQYQALYPTSSILLIKSSFTFYLNPPTARSHVSHAACIVHDVLVTDDSDAKEGQEIKESPRMLVHMFSNGGSCALYHLYDVYAEEFSTPARGGRIPPHVTVFDSVPGGWGYRASTNGVLYSLPAGLTRQLATPFIHLLGAFWWVKYRVLCVPEETVIWGRAHNDPRKAHESCRAYLYSEADDLVDFRAVDSHADDAEAHGFVVAQRCRFIDSEHVSHARKYPERYWRTVTETWESR